MVSHIPFRQSYDVVPLVFLLPDSDGGESASIRIRNITASGFDAFVVEPDGNDGPHNIMDHISYIAIEPGIHVLPNGTKLEAGSIDTVKYQTRLDVAGSSWETVALGSVFSATPAMLSMIQTTTNETHNIPPAASNPKTSEPWLTSVLEDVTTNNFKVALERSEAIAGAIVSNEAIGYLAIEANINGANSYFGDNNGEKITFETIRKVNFVDGWDNGGEDVNFVNSYTASPVVVASKNNRGSGTDGGWLRSGAGDNAGSPLHHINLRVDEDVATDSERGHIKNSVGVVVFSDAFDAEFGLTSDAKMVINEVMYHETVTGSNNDEFVEMYVTHAGDIKGYFLSDQDCNQYRFSASCSVAVGDYVIFHTGIGTDSCAGSVKHFYQGTSQYWNNTKDDVLLLRPNHDDRTTTTNTSGCGVNVYQAVPQDYMAYGSNGGAVDDVPTSLGGVTVSWTQSHATELDNAPDGTSVALTPNATDGDTAACWEFSASGNASNNSCVGYAPTRDTNTNAGQTNSITLNNTAMPDMHITKTSIVISDPVNTTSHPKRIPGAIVRYCFTVDNTGDGDAENATIHDSLAGSGRDNLTYIRSGSLVQNISTVCNCAAVTTTNGTISGSDVTINIGNINGTNDTTHSRGCAYIEATID